MKQILLLSAATLCALTAVAAPLKRADVKADPALVVHIDFDELRATSVGRAVLNQLNQPEIDSKLSALQSIFGFDPRTQLHGATLYANSKTPPDGVLIVYADFDSNRVVALGQMAPGFKTLTNGTHIIHTWIDEKAKNKDNDDESPHIYAAIKGNRVILSKSESSLTDELNLLDGSGATLAKTKTFPELGEAGKGNVVQAVVSRFDFGNSDPNAAILKMSKIVRFDVGEKADHIGATLSFEAKDADVATNISNIAQGLIALLRLQQGNPDILKIANAVSVHQDGSTVTAAASILSKDVSDLIKAKVAESEGDHASDSNSASAK